MRIIRGLDVGRIAQRGTALAEALGAAVPDRDGRPAPMWLGSYRIDLLRLAAAVVEQNHDERGISWPAAVAPHAVVIVQTRPGDPDQDALAADTYRRFGEEGIDAAWDDRDERAGVKFNDADLVGWPWRLVVGRDAADGRVELTRRSTGDSSVVTLDEAVRLVGASLTDR